MATLEKIRSKGVLLLIVVGTALLVFIIGDFVNSGSTYFNENSANVAIVNGDKIKIRDYSERMEQFNEVVKMEYGNINDEMSEQIRQMVWDATISEKLIADECENLGFMITKDELADMLIGEHISPILLNNRMFVNEKGQFDVNILKNFLATIDNESATQNMSYEQLKSYRNYWQYWEHEVKASRLQEKYISLLSNALVVNPLEAKYAYDNAKVSADAVYVMKDYFAIADSTISVSDKEIEQLYKEKKEQFKQKQSANIKYIATEIKPSQEDFNEVEKWINNLKTEFATTEDIAGIVNSNSDIQYRGENLTKEQIDADFKEFAFDGKKGDVMGPIFVDNTYKMARIVENNISSPDSVKISNIYVRKETAEATQTLADSIVNAVKGGANFAELAKQYSQTPNAKDGGEIGWFSEMGLDSKIATPAFSTPKNGIFQIKEGNDINIFIINDTKQNVAKAKLAIISRVVDASSRTRTNLYNQLKQYIVKNNTSETFESQATENGYVVMTANDIDINASKINNINKAREVVKWIFENEEGKMSDIFEVENHIITAVVTKINEEGYRSIEDVKPILISEIRNNKKGEMLTAEMKGKTMAELQTMGYRLDTIRNVNFASNGVGSIGNEPALFARVATAEVNVESAPIKGLKGAFIFKNINKTESTKEFNEKEEAVMLNAREMYMTQYLCIEVLKDAAKIKDFRYKYY